MKVSIKFPLDHKFVLEEPSASLVKTLVPDGKAANFWTLLTVTLDKDAKITGFGMPFSSPDNEVDAWVNDFKPIVDGISILELFRSRVFRVLVLRPLGPFRDMNWVPKQLGPPPPLQLPLRA